jgi:nucleotide-binding universal stress UspA family protein
VRVLHVIENTSAYLSADFVPHLVTRTAGTERDIQLESETLVSHAVRDLRRAGIKAKGVVEKGNAKSVILDYAKNWGADLIVVGSHGLRGMKRVLMGSVSEAIVRDAKRSVQVVRPGSRKGAAKPSTQRKRG